MKAIIDKVINFFSPKNKRGQAMASNIWGWLVTIAGIIVLFLVLLVLFGSSGLGGFFDDGSAEQNATEDARDRFISLIPLVLLIPLVVVLAAILGIVIGSFWFGGGRGRA